MSFTISKIAQFSKIFLQPQEVNYLILYVTSICNQKCSFCFYADSLNADWGHGLSLDQLEKVSKSLPNCIHITMTGGEPFVRKDLPEIVKLFCTNSKTINITFPTNGSLPVQIEKMLVRILKENPGCVFRVALSIDGLSDVHDEIRGMKNAFKKAEATFHVVKKLQKKFSNLVLIINSVASGVNKDKLKPFIDYAVENLWCDDHSLLLARGNTKTKESKEISAYEYHDLVAYFEQKKAEKRQADTLYKKLLKHIETRTREIADKTYRENKYILPCTAGKKLLVLYDSGNLAPCEIIDTLSHAPSVKENLGNFILGNIHDHNYSIKKILATKHAKNIQRYIYDSKCFCTFECAIAASISLELRNLKYLLKRI